MGATVRRRIVAKEGFPVRTEPIPALVHEGPGKMAAQHHKAETANLPNGGGYQGRAADAYWT